MKQSENKQKATEPNKMGEIMKTGLAPIQENAVALLIAGESISSVAEKLGVNRTTIYQWQSKEVFQCYYNLLLGEVKSNMENEILNLHRDAIGILRSSLTSDSEAIRMKTAFWIIERLDKKDVELIDPIEAIKNKCPYTTEYLDEGKFRRLLRENGLE